MNLTRSMETLTADVGYAFRTLRKSPGFALVAVLSGLCLMAAPAAER